jgi:hypothetical protein
LAENFVQIATIEIEGSRKKAPVAYAPGPASFLINHRERISYSYLIQNETVTPRRRIRPDKSFHNKRLQASFNQMKRLRTGLRNSRGMKRLREAL